MHPILFSIGYYNIYSYSIYLTAAFLLGTAFAIKQARSKEVDFNLTPKVALLTTLCGIIGARILYISLYYHEFKSDFLSIFYIWQGGLVFSGGLILGILSGILYLKSKSESLLVWADIFAPAICLAQAVGRLGCLFAGCCYGAPTNLPWGIKFHSIDSLAPLNRSLHPTQLYHSLAGLFTFTVLIIASKYLKQDGKITGLFLMLFSVLRFIIEFYRADYRGNFGAISVTQALCIPLLFLGVYLFFIHKQRRV